MHVQLRRKAIFLFYLPWLLIFVVGQACNLPNNKQNLASPDSGGIAAETNDFVDDTVESNASETIAPTSEEVSLDPMQILETYQSLETIRLRLDNMQVSNSLGGQDVTGRELLEWLLVDKAYDPQRSNAEKEEIFDGLDIYIYPYPSARIMLINIATGLWVEAHGWVPWSLQDYSIEDIENLFIEDETMHATGQNLHRGDLPEGMPNVLNHWHGMDDLLVEEAHYKQFNLASNLIQDAANQEDAVSAIVVWLQQNFFHAISPGYAWDVYLDGQEPRQGPGQIAYPLSLERVYEERVSGCHEPTLILEGMAHSLNIPAVRLSIHGHGVLYLPTLERYVHGDHVVAYTDAPFGSLLLTYDQILPFAQDQAYIYSIYYDTIYKTPFRSMPLWRDGDYLYIEIENVRNPGESGCIVIAEDEWTRISEQLSTYNLQYDTENCILSSDRLPILTLDELNQID